MYLLIAFSSETNTGKAIFFFAYPANWIQCELNQRIGAVEYRGMARGSVRGLEENESKPHARSSVSTSDNLLSFNTC